MVPGRCAVLWHAEPGPHTSLGHAREVFQRLLLLALQRAATPCEVCIREMSKRGIYDNLWPTSMLRWNYSRARLLFLCLGGSEITDGDFTSHEREVYAVCDSSAGGRNKPAHVGSDTLSCHGH
jgi:hypothetical protein